LGLPGACAVSDVLKPSRIQRQRTKGWRKPEGAVYVGRGTIWGNPYRVGVHGDAQKCCELYRFHAECSGSRLDEKAEERLRGRILMCFCPLDRPCHADVLLELANR
jgi:hypothetical protein